MGVTTAPMHTKDAQVLLWPYLRDMLTMGSWELAAQSENGFDFIPTSPAGRTGSFFGNPQWLEDRKRYELPEEFNRRLQEDHEKVIQEFEKETGASPIAFFFPYGDYGQYEEQSKVVRVTNMHQVGAHYELGFILGQLALNTRHSDPRRLNRLLVDPAWSPQAFIDKLETFWPVEPGRGKAHRACRIERWIGEWGGVTAQDNELVLRAIPPLNPVVTLQQEQVSATTGAKAWLAAAILQRRLLCRALPVKRDASASTCAPLPRANTSTSAWTTPASLGAAAAARHGRDDAGYRRAASESRRAMTAPLPVKPFLRATGRRDAL